MKFLSFLKQFQLRALIGQVAVFGGAGVLLLRQFGFLEAAESLAGCTQNIDGKTFESCRETFNFAMTAIMAVGAQLNLLANSRGQSDVRAKKELDQKAATGTIGGHK